MLVLRQDAGRVRVDAYPFTQFGDIPGELKRVGKQSLDLANKTPNLGSRSSGAEASMPRKTASVPCTELHIR